jgi:FAD/FMN-containing dehydrogenase
MRLSLLPTQVAEVMENGAGTARAHGLASAWSAHAGVGVVTASLFTSRGDADTVAAVLGEWRAAARAGGGHATLEWAPLAVKSQVPVWDDLEGAGRLMHAIKTRLDPHGILNPGRFVASA